MAKKVIYRVDCPHVCSEIRSVLVHEEAVSRLIGQSRLCDKRWLCDECVNGVLAKMMCNFKEDQEECDVFLFSTYFYERLRRNFTYATEVAEKKKDNILSKQRWLIPVCTSCHWHAAVVDTEKKKITMFDSLHIQQESVAERIRKFVQHFFPSGKWNIVFDRESIPLQPNNYDCGVFMIKALEKQLYSLKSSIDPGKGSTYREQFLMLLSGTYRSDSSKSESNLNASDKGHSHENSFTMEHTAPKKILKLSLSKKSHSKTLGSLTINQNTTPQLEVDTVRDTEKSIHPTTDQTTISCNTSTKPDESQGSLAINSNPSSPKEDTSSYTKGSTNDQPLKSSDLITSSYTRGADHLTNDLTQNSSDLVNTTNSNPKEITNSNEHSESVYDFSTCDTHHFNTPMEQRKVLPWKQLDTQLQSVLPSDSKYTYVVEDFQAKPKDFEGAPVNPFDAVIRINLTSENEAKQWVEDMMSHSLTTYRTTRTFKSAMKRVQCKMEMHCQHFRKPLTNKQKQTCALAKSKKSRSPITHMNRDKKTQCSSKLTLVVQIPTKKQQRSSDKYPYLLTHTGLLKLNFCHNHPMTSGHTLSFRDVCEETKQAFFDLFSIGHSASTAKHTHEQQLMNDAETEAEMQMVLADRSQNPLPQDVCRLFRKWQESTYGKEDGKELFETLQERVDEFNETFHSQGGKAKLQWYEADIELFSDGDDDEREPKKKKAKFMKETPFILCLCTPLMARVHEKVCQAGETIFCDSTSSLDRFNTSLFVLSTTHCASGMPLGVILTSDETEATLAKALEMFKSILPESAFFGRGPSVGPEIIMTDDCAAERGALQQAWPSSILLLCTFHFLQRRWTWLWEGKNGIHNSDRKLLIDKVKELVYAQSESLLQELYISLKANEVARKYPNFITHMESLMDKAKEWAHCYRKGLMIRGNHTNNYAEAGIKLLKEMVFSRIKAYNMVQMFYFVVDTMDRYYQRKLISIANNRLETYVALRFKGVNTKMIKKEDIQKGSGNWYSVHSQSERSKWYDVNPAIGVCTCTKGRDGSPCSHQAAIVCQFGEESLNYICTLSAQARLKIAQIALGNKAILSTSFYASLHQQAIEERYTKANMDVTSSDHHQSRPDFTGTEWDLIRAGAQPDDPHDADYCLQAYNDHNYMSNRIEQLAKDMKNRLLQSDDQLTSGIDKFIERYFKLSSGRSMALLASALHNFGKESGAVIRATNTGHLRHGKRIPIQATASGRRRRGVSRGKAKIPAGRTVKRLECTSNPVITRYFLPTRKEPKGKRQHNLSQNISKGRQNAGKW